MTQDSLFLNLACDKTYVNNHHWVNVDFVSTGPGVYAHNLLKPLPFSSQSFDLVYSSHFLEHIPRRQVRGFLSECYRVIKPGGTIRLVLPDAIEMFQTYLSLRSNQLHDHADFVITQIIDQCVRKDPGGELLRFYQRVLTMDSPSREKWLDFVSSRNGESFLASPKLARRLSVSISYLYRRLLYFLRWKIHQIGVLLLLPAFREQNVSFAGIGEKHAWLWDFYQLESELLGSGFLSVKRESHLSSRSDSFPFVPLDATIEGNPRKGAESMYVEAVKP